MENSAREVVGVEVKAAATVTTRDLSSLRYLAKIADESFKLGACLYNGFRLFSFEDTFFAVTISTLWT